MRIGRTTATAAALVVATVLGLPGAARADGRTRSYSVGPIPIRGYETLEPDVEVPSPPVDGSLVAMHAEVVDSRGRPVPQTEVMLHHAVFVNRGRFDGDRRGDYCAVRPREPFYGTAEEDTPLRLPPGYGYPIHRGDRWRLQYMLMNHRARHRTVWMRYTVTTDTAPKVPVTPYWVSVACKNQRIYNVPGGGAPGATDVRSTVWTAPRAGRIVALVGHLHGGGESLDLREPDCGGRLLASATARYGGVADPIYAMSPMLHEPSPRSVGIASSAQGWPIRAGERLVVDSVYDNVRPHVKVMGIGHIYMAQDAAGAPPPALCPPLPTDVSEVRLPFLGAPGRTEVPVVRQDLSRRGADGVGRPLDLLKTPFTHFTTPHVTIDVRRFAFAPQQAVVAPGTAVTWRFQDRRRHDVSWVEGPRGFASRYERRGGAYTTTFTVPGTYRYFCSLHPVDMPATITVRPG